MPAASFLVAPWVETFPVRLFETDAHGVLSPAGLCDYLQEAAGNHAHSLGFSVAQLLQKGLTWVLSRFRLRIERLPAAGETVRVRTWPAGAEKLFARRDFEVLDGEGARIAAATSAWLILDISARRPVRIQTVFDPPDASRTPRALDLGFEKVPLPDAFDREIPVLVRLSDLDANAHANNARIAGWIVEGIGRDEWERGSLRELDIDFLAEAMAGDAVDSRAAARPGGQFLHSLVRRGDGKEIARACTTWVERAGENRRSGS